MVQMAFRWYKRHRDSGGAANMHRHTFGTKQEVVVISVEEWKQQYARAHSKDLSPKGGEAIRGVSRQRVVFRKMGENIHTGTGAHAGQQGGASS
jgi:hypothetical protein